MPVCKNAYKVLTPALLKLMIKPKRESFGNKKEMLKFKPMMACLLMAGLCIPMYAKKIQEEEYVIEESGLNVTKITDEGSNSVVGSTSGKNWFKNIFSGTSTIAGSKKSKLQWGTLKTLAVSPDGSEIAYLTRNNDKDNVMVKRSSGSGASTQRTFRDIWDFGWGPDGNLYVSEAIGSDEAKISSIDAHKGSAMRQISSNNFDRNPATKDGNVIFFTRIDKNGPSIWSFNKSTAELVNCARGYQPFPISNEEFYCTRNNKDGNSEIWLVNFVNGQETLIVSDKTKGFSNPSLSPDGEWILMQGNAKSATTKKENLDIFVVKPDGTQLTQLTFHPGSDFCPVWSADGKQIFFISSRGTKKDSYNVWRMNFEL